jgi:outer membrane protein OmpA-like peptidoglycan-associated protein/tetratricopeptide (TPR) repeat protein
MRNVIRKSAVLILVIVWSLPSVCQTTSKKELIKAVQEADIFYYYDQNYEKAAEMYSALLKKYPNNANLMAKLGICYLNIDGKKSEALQLLEKASKNIVKDDKEYLEYGEKAPLDTYLYLPIAYHQNDSLQKAITLFYDAKRKMSGSKIFKDEYIDNQIRDCKYALDMKKKPLVIDQQLFADWLADYQGACNPVLAKNDSVFVFTQNQNGKTKIFCSYKNGKWKRPSDITKQLGGYDGFFSNSITGDGKMLIIYMDDGGDGNLYYSTRKDSLWTKIKAVGKPINTIYWQSHGFITPDGKGMYFASNKPGGEGGLDIWYSERMTSGKWSEPVNLGNVINTPYNEDTPFFDPETGALLFSSTGHISMGGYDVFRSVKKNGIWTNPIGMPYSFNNSLENTFFILNNHKPGFITSLYDEKTRTRNIFEIVAENPADKITLAKGLITLQDGMAVDPKTLKILLVDLKNPGTSKEISLLDSASFKFELKPGDYQVFVSQAGYKTDTINLNIPMYFSGNYVSVNSSLIPDKVFGGDFLAIKNVLFEFNSADLNAEAKVSLDALRSILISYPELNVEVAGYTDAIGSKEYNYKLADKRAQSAISYLKSSGIESTRFIKKAVGKADFVALNNNRDGSDNPEGRKYNRRVAFGVVDPKTGIILRQESYTPEHLRQPYSMRYSIVLLKTNQKVATGHFKALTKDDLLFVRTIKSDSLTIYSLGFFYNKFDAQKYLEYVKTKGFDNAYILNQYELDDESKSIVSPEEKKTTLSKIDQAVVTIQVKATRNPININKIFSGLDGVNEIKASDGFYKYYYGAYKNINTARENLANIKKMGFEDAFIRNLYQLLSQ